MAMQTSFTKEQTEFILASKRRLVAAFQNVLDVKQYRPENLDDARNEFNAVVQDIKSHDETNSTFLTRLISGFEAIINEERGWRPVLSLLVIYLHRFHLFYNIQFLAFCQVDTAVLPNGLDNHVDTYILFHIRTDSYPQLAHF